MSIAFVLALIVVAMVLLSLETVPVDVVALGVLAALLLARILEPKEAFAGFGNEAVIALAGIFVLAAGLQSSGAIGELGRVTERLFDGRPGLAIPALLLLVAAVSAFINNTTCTALFLPIVLVFAERVRVAPSRVLMPLAFASILGGSITVIGTSTNVIVRGLLPEYGEAPLGMFELAPVALPVALCGLVYLGLARRLLPARDAEIGARYPLREYLTDVEILPDSPLVGQTVREADLGRLHDLTLVALVSGGHATRLSREHRLAAGDVLVVEGSAESLLGLAKSGLVVRAEAKGGDLVRSRGMNLVEAAVLPRSELVGRTLKESGFRQRYAANVIAVCRHGEPTMEKLGRIRLRVGDVLLVLGGSDAAQRLHSQRALVVLDSRSLERPRRGRVAVATGIFVAVVLAVSFGLLGLGTAVLAGCFLLLATRTLTPQEAYAAIEWRLLVLIAGMMGYAAAMEKTGAAALLADGVVGLTSNLGPHGILAGCYVLTLLLTQPMSNQAAVLVVLPVAMELAASSGINPRAIAVTVTLAASSSFLTPFEPSSLLVYGPGRYRFRDFLRFGAGLTVVAMVLTLVLVPIFWPL